MAKKVILLTIGVIFLGVVGYTIYQGIAERLPTKVPMNIPNTNLRAVTPKMDEDAARVVAEQTCVKGGEALGSGSYNPNSKTWWFDANLNATQPGCNPACVVSEETKTAEINWRCTGLIVPQQ